jgi:glycosyltransferase involved in cell wall biosynthesis
MIPTYNCAAYLRRTLESVLAQVPGPLQMQIEVVDDVSTKDDPEPVVREVGKGRVQLHRHAENLGATRNLNECLRRSRGRWIHILHGDDYVLPRYYERVGKATAEYPDVAMISTLVFVVDEFGEICDLMARAKGLEKGNRDALQFAGVVLARRFVEEAGGFAPNLVHVADWEMWVRALARNGAASVNEPLACYREFAGNDTSRLRKTGENLRDYLRAAERFRHTVEGFNVERFRTKVASLAADQARRFRALGDEGGAAANRKLWRELTPWPRRVRQALMSFARRAAGAGGV